MAQFVRFFIERLREKGAARMLASLPSRRSAAIVAFWLGSGVPFGSLLTV